jgi:hypothetical protein
MRRNPIKWFTDFKLAEAARTTFASTLPDDLQRIIACLPLPMICFVYDHYAHYDVI